MKTETIVLHHAVWRGPPAASSRIVARPFGTVFVTDQGVVTAHASRRGLGAMRAILLHHEATPRIQEAVLLDHAAADE